MIDVMPIELTLLAGGKSRRMGADKLALRLPDGGLLVERWLQNLAWPGPTAIVLPQGGAAPDGVRVDRTVFDAVADQGPLRGVSSALAESRSEWHVFVPVDMPGVTRAQVDWMLSQRAIHPTAQAFMTQRTRDGESTVEPLPMLIHVSMKSAVDARLEANRRSLHGLADEPSAVLLDAPSDWPDDVWLNLNRPADLESYLKRYR